MALFGKREKGFELFLSLEQRVNLEDDVLALYFEHCKKQGFPLLKEPSFDGSGDQTWISFTLKEDLWGSITYFNTNNEVMIQIYQKPSSNVTEDKLVAALSGFMQDLYSKTNIAFTAKKEGKKKYQYEKWEAMYPAHRTFL